MDGKTSGAAAGWPAPVAPQVLIYSGKAIEYRCCLEGAVALPSELSAEEVNGGVQITWRHAPKDDRIYTFYVTLHERYFSYSWLGRTTVRCFSKSLATIELLIVG